MSEEEPKPRSYYAPILAWLIALILIAVACHKYPIWTQGFLISLLGGHIAASFVLWWFWGRNDKEFRRFPHGYLRAVFGGEHIPPPGIADNDEEPDPWKGAVPSWLTGIGERVFFTVLIGVAGIEPIAAPMIGWLGIKLAVNWRRRDADNALDRQKELRVIIRHSQVSTYASLVSLSFAVLGGLMIDHGLLIGWVKAACDALWS